MASPIHPTTETREQNPFAQFEVNPAAITLLKSLYNGLYYMRPGDYSLIVQLPFVVGTNL